MGSRKFIDQLGRNISINYPPQRIISLVPSQTELLFDLGLGKKVVGITKFCIHPADKFKSTSKVGGTKKLDIEKIRKLQPDLIIGNKEENDQQQIEVLMQEFPVWMSDINILDQAIWMVQAVGLLTGTELKANHFAAEIVKGFETLTDIGKNGLRVAYFIWKDPYMVAGKNTFIDDLLTKAGLDNFSKLSRYPEVSKAEISKSKPDVIFLSSEPYPFKNLHVKEMQNICPTARVMVVDGEMFSWYGSRLLHTPSYLRTLVKELH